MSTSSTKTRLTDLPNEVLYQSFECLDVLKNGRGLMLVNKHIYQLVQTVLKKEANKHLSKIDHSLRSRCLQEDLSDIDYALRLSRVKQDRTHLESLFTAMVDASDHYYNSGITDFEINFSFFYYFVAWPRNTGVDVFSMYDTLESTSLHFRRYASTREVLDQVSTWSTSQLLRFSLTAQIFGQLISSVQQHITHPSRAFQRCYVQASKLVLLLFGARPLLLLIMRLVRASPSADFIRRITEAVPDEDSVVELRRGSDSWPDLRRTQTGHPCFHSIVASIRSTTAFPSRVPDDYTLKYNREGPENLCDIPVEDLAFAFRWDLIVDQKVKPLFEDSDFFDMDPNILMGEIMVLEVDTP